MTLTDCQIFMTVSQLGTFAAAAEQMHLTPSAISHAVSGMGVGVRVSAVHPHQKRRDHDRCRRKPAAVHPPDAQQQ